MKNAHFSFLLFCSGYGRGGGNAGRGGRLFDAERLLKSSSQQDLPRKHVDSNFQKCFGFNSLKSPFLVVSETSRKDIGSSILRG